MRVICKSFLVFLVLHEIFKRKKIKIIKKYTFTRVCSPLVKVNIKEITFNIFLVLSFLFFYPLPKGFSYRKA